MSLRIVLAALLGCVSCANGPDLRPGQIYCIGEATGASSMIISKVLEVEPKIVHVRQFTNSLKSCPSNPDLEAFTWKVSDLPYRRSGFLALNPRLIGYAVVKPDEADGVREMKQYLENAGKQ